MRSVPLWGKIRVPRIRSGDERDAGREGIGQKTMGRGIAAAKKKEATMKNEQKVYAEIYSYGVSDHIVWTKSITSSIRSTAVF